MQRALSRKPRSGEKGKKINGNHNIFVLIFLSKFQAVLTPLNFLAVPKNHPVGIFGNFYCVEMRRGSRTIALKKSFIDEKKY